ncbi:MAG: phosphatidylserine decarboxylase [Deltaproteobacteria bacterium RIFCSPLOWO2_12_FULL_44_12]|nr:MAG: phosphatidylserine decarboxylase [Deltaproteobacteria bacterium RIFCSPHIGHO2_01_FULL_43_49]OGQ15783.1 MAG: phosphatidylserine decarboxylase [Deltaproteobacteria bacterium RIFCSPHIGHO2_02_FULL_44_53]OGQ28739.1 MAG: phosphatidylserine decarboxylase [Deltaproteobacteria bacterium RIFCSPHIGHO2_12_FULL_44_21]OGQ32075.1 MAG: phosphatidylserine decarboxylase [Deltaproteobacteria bacterium RIFCSPLOWO2_01_FULL_45_74]OGQ43688.1 MAG: phosphatidylserine decarboxylase [Deltaproteobacteria bacterium 
MLGGEPGLPCYRKKPRRRLVTQEGYPYIFFSALITFVTWVAFGEWGALFPFLLTLYIVSFFRNPPRRRPAGEEFILAPADGKILEVVDCDEKRYLKGRAKRISIFMSPFNCHINRSPISGTVVDCFYQTGSFKAAFKRKAMDHNEHHAVLMRDQYGKSWLVIQIAGFLARRIISYIQSGDALKRGNRFGLIQFGSRTDLYCPFPCEIFVKKGQRVYAGKTILGRIS